MVHNSIAVLFSRLSLPAWNGLVFLLALTASSADAQTLYDSFADGDFTASPVWGGNTSDWQIVANSDAAAGATGSQTLRLNGPVTAGTRYLSSQASAWGSCQEWGFWVGRRAQAFTAANQMYIWLYANESNLTSATVDGYRLAIGDDSGTDEIRLEYVVNGAVSATVITSSGALTNGLTDVGFLLRVGRSSAGVWTLFSSVLPTANGTGAIATNTPSSANASVSQGSGTHNTLVPATNGYLGVAALHSTATDARATAELDQVYFSPDPSVALGTYPNATVNAGQNTTVVPGTAPVNTSWATAAANTNFTGLLSVNPATGVVTVTDAKQAGIYTVTVTGINSCGTSTASFTLTVDPQPLARCQALFGGATNVSVSTFPYSVAIGDFNGDGKQDFAAANNGSTTVSIRLGDGLGGFSGTTNVTVGTSPRSVALGDFNNDGKQDFAAANDGSNTVSIRLGDGLGGFSGTTNVSVGTTPVSVAVGDFNGDGNQDFAAANNGSNTVSIRLGNGLGGFSSATDVATGTGPWPIAIGDFNADGKQDFAVANGGSNTISIRLGNGLGGFSSATDVSVGSAPRSVAIGDFNADGKQDLAASFISGTDAVSIRLGDGLGGFSGTTDVAVGSNPYSVAIGDFDGDGKQDFAAANFSSGTVSIRLGDGLGGFSGATNVSVGTGPISVAIGDFNGDGYQDLAAANNSSATVSIRLGDFNEINVRGNSMDIADGDNTPTTVDHTDYGAIDINASLARTFTIQNTDGAPLTI
ncbi:MAG: VCBS repeat-containing protein, partial [Saprospiraceae bacterium]|nr:VCBS repeat-containing protein [Saprospiraceae bacterium]